MSGLKAANLPTELILIIANNLEAARGNVRSTMQLNRHWRQSITLAKSYAYGRKFKLKSELDLRIISEFLDTCHALDTTIIAFTTIVVKTAGLFERLPFKDHRIYHLTLDLDSEDDEGLTIRMPPKVLIRGDLIINDLQEREQTLEEFSLIGMTKTFGAEFVAETLAPESRLRRSEDSYTSSKIKYMVDLRPLTKSYPTIVKEIRICNVAPIINPGQHFDGICNLFVEGSDKVVAQCVQQLLPNTPDLRMLHLTQYNRPSQMEIEAPSLPLLPSLPSLTHISLEKCFVDAREAGLEKLDGVNIDQGSMIVDPSSGFLRKLESVYIKDDSTTPASTLDHEGFAYIAEPRCLEQMIGLNRFHWDFPNSQHLGELYETGLFDRVVNNANSWCIISGDLRFSAR